MYRQTKVIQMKRRWDSSGLGRIFVVAYSYSDGDQQGHLLASRRQLKYSLALHSTQGSATRDAH